MDEFLKKSTGILPLIINLGFVVWFAATTSARLESISTTQIAQTALIEKIVNRMNQQDIDMAVYKYQQQEKK